jgi:hypothetical protein
LESWPIAAVNSNNPLSGHYEFQNWMGSIAGIDLARINRNNIKSRGSMPDNYPQ